MTDISNIYHDNSLEKKQVIEKSKLGRSELYLWGYTCDIPRLYDGIYLCEQDFVPKYYEFIERDNKDKSIEIVFTKKNNCDILILKRKKMCNN